MPSLFEWVVTIALPLQLTAVTYYFLSPGLRLDDIDATSTAATAASGSTFVLQWILYIFLEASYGNFFHALLLVPARWLARRLPGAVVPDGGNEKAWAEQEEEANDDTLVWPKVGSLDRLGRDWIVGCPEKKNDDGMIHGSVNDISREARQDNGRAGQEMNGSSRVSSAATLKSRKKHNKTQSKQSPAETTSNALSITQQTQIQQKKRQKQKQPYYLNHARGSTRIRQASQRIAAAIGTLAATYVMCSISPLLTVSDIGLTPTTHILSDLMIGFLIGSSVILVLFLFELSMGWIAIIGYFQTVEPKEKVAINFSWDVLFHVGVAINEEIMLRGWMFVLGVRGVLTSFFSHYHFHTDEIDVDDADTNTTTTNTTTDNNNAIFFAVITSILLQSTLFSLLHFHSPGSTATSLINLFVGGIAASFNVLAANGSLYLGIGWHFGWNITMGHVLGRSTSGIPMSCAVVEVIPNPKEGMEKWHGGMFGMEQGSLVSGAYLAGMGLVFWVYGWEGMEKCVEGLVG
mmetsp:Transcript_3561/g.7631  ORF Transcript_3561/g.7631 Transcript_3561/m.7631 type:complete len:518 (-) Transcript_3561:216-1769(-)|eukprot:CAMPEP_0171413802 /NCGR_PEP_ID=MMETSP0880-20121228/35845_1 /TAXON_ID=67004 /ORGANISM="Thalassiosira weissflogii, Strain CCMP1336" /LENGTH=517 /DNA_ID=CAMNT_0011931559 /DNA_START=65 /DNA_END=1618 /DNA_ORIENTATION=+